MYLNKVIFRHFNAFLKITFIEPTHEWGSRVLSIFYINMRIIILGMIVEKIQRIFTRIYNLFKKNFSDLYIAILSSMNMEDRNVYLRGLSPD